MTYATSLIEQMSTALTAHGLQQQAIASNLANRDAQGYQRLKVQFDGALARAGEPRLVADASDAPVSLEQDLVALSSNALQFQALARVMSRYFAIAAAIANPTGA